MIIIPIPPREFVRMDRGPVPFGLVGTLSGGTEVYATGAAAARGHDGRVRCADMSRPWLARWLHCGGSRGGATSGQYETFVNTYQQAAGESFQVQTTEHWGELAGVGCYITLFRCETLHGLYMALAPHYNMSAHAWARSLDDNRAVVAVLREYKTLWEIPHSKIAPMERQRREDRLRQKLPASWRRREWAALSCSHAS